MRTFFSTHAFERVAERLSLDTEEVAALLTYDLAMLIGREAGTSRIHRLFYSVPDGQCFIAVQDESNGEVVTILPIDFAAWAVSLETQRAAEALTRQRPPLRSEQSAVPMARPLPDASHVLPSVFRITATFRFSSGRWAVRLLGSIPAAPYGFDPDRLASDPGAQEQIGAWVQEHENREGMHVVVYTVRLGKNGSPTSFLCAACLREERAADSDL
ncbi:MAG: hypothetical protein Q7S02_00010 [bacterium]|nr:hypothetical protein [bacterium]